MLLSFVQGAPARSLRVPPMLPVAHDVVEPQQRKGVNDKDAYELEQRMPSLRKLRKLMPPPLTVALSPRATRVCQRQPRPSPSPTCGRYHYRI